MGTNRHEPGDGWQQGLVLGLVVFVVGLVTRTRDVGGDDTVFAMAVDAWLHGRGPFAELFDTYHLIYSPLVACTTWVVRLLRPHALVLDVGAGVSSFFWGVASGGLMCVLRRHRVPAARALLAAAAVAACGGMWSIATRMEVYTLAAAALVGWLAACAADRPRPVVLGASLAAACLAHVALVVLVVPTAWRLRRRVRDLPLALAIGLGIPAIATLALFTIGRNIWSWSGWIEQVLPQESLGYIETTSPWMAPRALHGLVLWNWYRAVPVLLPAAARVLDVAGQATLVLAAGLALVGAWRAVRDEDVLGRTSLVALAGFLPLWLAWDVGNPEHAVAAAPLFGVLIALGASGRRTPDPSHDALLADVSTRAGRLHGRTGDLALGTLLMLLLVVNGIGGAALQRQPDNGRLWVTAGFVQQHVGPQAVVLSLGADPRLRLGLGYLSGRHVADLTLAVRSARIAGRPPEDGLTWWLERARQTSELWALDEVVDRSSEDWVVGLGIPRQTWRVALASWQSTGSAELAADGAVVRRAFRIHRLSPATDRVSAPDGSIVGRSAQ